MFNSQHPRREQNTTDARASFVIPYVDLEPTHPGCLVCRLRDAGDRLATTQWHASAQQDRQEIPGVLFCPLHAWRAWEVAYLAAQSSTGTADGWHAGPAALAFLAGYPC